MTKIDIDIQINAQFTRPKVIIQAPELSPDVQAVIDHLRQEEDQPYLMGWIDEKLVYLDEAEIIRIYAQEGKVLCQTTSQTYVLKIKLYELEHALKDSKIIRISNSEFVNLKQVSHFDLSFSGTIRIHLKNKEMTFVSRRYVTKVKDKLGI